MSRLILVRHGQARFLTDDYDRLSDHGRDQARWAGEHLAAAGVSLDHAYCGTLKRQRETGREVLEVYRRAGREKPELDELAGLNEFPAETVIERLGPVMATSNEAIATLASAAERHRDGPDSLRHMQRYIETVVDHWVHRRFDARAVPELPSWEEFVHGVQQALATVRDRARRGSTSIVFTSGGPVAVAVQTVLGAPSASAAALCWRVYNGSFTEFTFSDNRISLDCFNNSYHIPAEHRTYR